MNSYYELLKHIKTIFEQDANVSTVSTEEAGLIDNYKKNLFPLVHVNVLEKQFTGINGLAVDRYLVEIYVLDIRDINKNEVNDKFWNNDNRHDNLNTTQAILNKALNKMVKDRLDTGITLVSSTSATPNVYEYSNLLDGWNQTWTVEVPDTLTTVC
jgi:hypothetical protein